MSADTFALLFVAVTQALIWGVGGYIAGEQRGRVEGQIQGRAEARERS